MTRRLAIFNPAAGLARANRRLIAGLVGRGAVPDLECTHGPGDATRIAREASGYDELLVVGGDGTVAEVLNGMDRSRQRLALVPAGHGNCLARDLGVGEMTAALAALEVGRSEPIDLMRVDIRTAATRRNCLAASTLALGYVADVVRLGRTRLAWLGRHAYTAAALMTRPRSLRVGMHGDSDRSVTTLVVNNTAHLANFRAFHDARLDDGTLDAFESSYGWGRQMLHNGAILAGSQRFGPARLWQAPGMVLRLTQPTLLMLDGELTPAVLEVAIACESAAVRCVSAVR
ncbi:MAG: diacylglycerol kinase family protein [Proteobacteria bacterium]|nr:diacylglycerol kinase family protein [Pseudomonadota bacterium]